MPLASVRLRIAHLTDIHVEPELRAGEGMAACFHHVQQLADKPDLILTGGDSVMDSFEADDARTTLQWNLWNSVLKNECWIPVRSCIGNHDVWGWIKSKSKTTGQEPNWGKKRADRDAASRGALLHVFASRLAVRRARQHATAARRQRGLHGESR